MKSEQSCSSLISQFRNYWNWSDWFHRKIQHLPFWRSFFRSCIYGDGQKGIWIMSFSPLKVEKRTKISPFLWKIAKHWIWISATLKCRLHQKESRLSSPYTYMKYMHLLGTSIKTLLYNIKKCKSFFTLVFCN